MAALYIIN